MRIKIQTINIPCTWLNWAQSLASHMVPHKHCRCGPIKKKKLLWKIVQAPMETVRLKINETIYKNDTI